MNKMINHIKYHHNYSNWALLDCFNSASMELQLNSEDGGLAVLDQADPSAAGANNSQFIVEVTGCGNPNQEYNCYMCNAVYADCGAHLLFQVMLWITLYSELYSYLIPAQPATVSGCLV